MSEIRIISTIHFTGFGLCHFSNTDWADWVLSLGILNWQSNSNCRTLRIRRHIFCLFALGCLLSISKLSVSAVFKFWKNVNKRFWIFKKKKEQRSVVARKSTEIKWCSEFCESFRWQFGPKYNCVRNHFSKNHRFDLLSFDEL